MITLVILVVLATLGYTMTVRVGARHHRDRYVIDYSQAQYACASALKYAMTSVSSLEPQLISRPNEPDFSDLFAMSEADYQKFMAQFARSAKNVKVADANGSNERIVSGKDAKKKLSDDSKKGRDAKAKVKRNAKTKKTLDPNSPGFRNGLGDVNDINDVNDVDAKSRQVSGPYGPPWPLVTEAMECEIGSAKVKIEVEDENAKYPLNWAMISDEQWKSLAETGFSIFCEWMGYTANDITDMRKDLGKIGELRPYQLEIKQLPTKAAATEPPASLRSRVSRTPEKTAAGAPGRRTAAKTTAPASPAEQLEQRNADYVKLFHSSMIDTDLLSRPSIVSDTRNESAMKYLGLWVVKQVNINSAPRHVLEAALTFGSAANAPKIATEIIRIRQTKPFTDIEELKKSVFQYSDAIDKCKDFLTTTSTVFTIRVTAVSGVARATIIAAVSKEGNKVKQIGIVSD